MVWLRRRANGAEYSDVNSQAQGIYKLLLYIPKPLHIIVLIIRYQDIQLCSNCYNVQTSLHTDKTGLLLGC